MATKIKLWQLQSAPTGGSMLVSDQDGNLVYLAKPQNIANAVLVLSEAGLPTWVENEALAKAVNAQQSADSAVTTANAYTDTKIAGLVDGAPVALDTLRKLAELLQDDDDAVAALISQVDKKADKNTVYVRSDIVSMFTDARANATAYTDALKTAIVAAIPIRKQAMCYGVVDSLDKATVHLSELDSVDGDPVPADAALRISQVFINGQLGLKNVDFVTSASGSTFSNSLLQFPENKSPETSANVAVMISWDETVQLAFPPQVGHAA